MNILNSTDRWLLNRVFEPASQAFQLFTGQPTNFLAFGCLAISVLISWINAMEYEYLNIVILAFKITILRAGFYGYSLFGKTPPEISSTRSLVSFIRCWWLLYVLTLLVLQAKCLKGLGFIPLPLFLDLQDCIMFLSTTFFAQCGDYRPPKSILAKWLEKIDL